jgi:hypothetical protein
MASWAQTGTVLAADLLAGDEDPGLAHQVCCAGRLPRCRRRREPGRQLACDGQVIRVHPARHDPAKEHGAFATPNSRPRKPKPAPEADHVADLPNSIRRTGTGT